MKRFSLVSLAILMVGILIFGGCAGRQEPAPATTPAPTPGQPIELSFAYWPPPEEVLPKRQHTGYARTIERLTKGRVKINVFGGCALGPPPDHLEIGLSGRADMSLICTQFTPGVFPYCGVTVLPLIFTSATTAARATWNLMEEYLLDTEFKDMHPLFTSQTCLLELQTNKPVHTLEDFKGLKLATVAPEQVPMTEALGATPVVMPEVELYTAEERGLVDGRWGHWDSSVVWKDYEVTKYRTGDVDIASMGHTVVFMNLDSWNALPPDIKEIFDGLRLGYSVFAGATYDECDLMNLKIIEAYDEKVGNPGVYWLPKEERARWVEAVAPTHDAWVSETESKGYTQAREILEFVKSLAKLYATGEK